jgi:hypothetical protein
LEYFRDLQIIDIANNRFNGALPTNLFQIKLKVHDPPNSFSFLAPEAHRTAQKTQFNLSFFFIFILKKFKNIWPFQKISKMGPCHPWGGRQAFFVKKIYKPILGQRGAGLGGDSPLGRQGHLLYISPTPPLPPHLSPKISPKIQKKRERNFHKKS